MTADLVLLNANVLTMNPANPHAEAVAIVKDRILKVGKNTEINPLIGKNTTVLTLQGKTVIPGFIDTHIHIADFGRTLTWLDLKNVDSIKTIQNKITQKAHTMPKGKWILGSGWNQDNLKEKCVPTSHDLDSASPDNPVILYHQLGRTCTANTKALKLAGITAETTSPKDGTIDKNPQTGEPTGILHGNATDLIWNKIPPPTEQETLESTKQACQKILEAGITTAHWIICTATELAIAQKLTRENIPLRIYTIITANLLENLPNQEEHPPKIDAVLIFEDDYLASQTAALNEPYTDNPATKGNLLYTQEELNRLVAKIQKNNLQVIIHATGDKALDAALKALEANPTEKSKSKKRHRLEQAAVLNKQLIQRIKKQEVTVSIQPRVVESEFSVWSAIDRVGIKRARWLYPLKALLKENIRVICGSDCPMEPLSPLSGIRAAVARLFFPEERITVDEALRMYTVNAAYASLEEGIKGSIETGKLADFAVLSHDPCAVPSDEIENIVMEMTIVGGRVVHPASLS